jgi:pSer/pThr/pTyr-binding forkhead associated (FHA) protein
VKDGEAVLTDLGSTNGTKLNGQQIQTRALGDGDRITIGTTLLEFRRG